METSEDQSTHDKMKKFIIFRIETKILVCLILTFIFSTIIGTVSHEYGHFIAAKFLGVNAKVHYAYTCLIPDENHRFLSKNEHFIFTLGGPLQTIITGTIGLILLCINKNNILNLNKLHFKHWVCVFLSFFWLRQPANFIMWLIGYLATGKYSKEGDEIKLANYLNIPDWSICLLTATMGLMVAIIVIFKYVPINQRFTLIVSGLIGGTLGFYIWLMSFGEIIMP